MGGALRGPILKEVAMKKRINKDKAKNATRMGRVKRPAPENKLMSRPTENKAHDNLETSRGTPTEVDVG